MFFCVSVYDYLGLIVLVFIGIVVVGFFFEKIGV